MSDDIEARRNILDRCLATIERADHALAVAERMARFGGYDLPELPPAPLPHAEAVALPAPKAKPAEPAAKAEQAAPKTARPKRSEASSARASGIRSWTEADDATLRRLWGEGVKGATIAITLGRTPAAVLTRAMGLRLPSRRGRKLTTAAPSSPGVEKEEPPAAAPPAPAPAVTSARPQGTRCRKCKQLFPAKPGQDTCRLCEARAIARDGHA